MKLHTLTTILQQLSAKMPFYKLNSPKRANLEEIPYLENGRSDENALPLILSAKYKFLLQFWISNILEMQIWLKSAIFS